MRIIQKEMRLPRLVSPEGLGDDIGADNELRHRQREAGKRHGMAAHHDGIKAQENSGALWLHRPGEA